MKTRVIISIVFVGLGLIIAAVPQNTTKPFKLSAEELLYEAMSKDRYYTADFIADRIINKDPNYQLIDVRTPNEFDKFHLPGAVNIPLSDLLSDDYAYLIDQNQVVNVFYSNGTLKADEAWLITKQLGYINNYVLQGGLNYWAETILNPEKPSSTSPDEEMAKYNFRMGAAKALGTEVDSDESADSSTPTPLPVVKKRPSRKRVAGGC